MRKEGSNPPLSGTVKAVVPVKSPVQTGSGRDSDLFSRSVYHTFQRYATGYWGENILLCCPRPCCVRGTCSLRISFLHHALVQVAVRMDNGVRWLEPLSSPASSFELIRSFTSSP